MITPEQHAEEAKLAYEMFPCSHGVRPESPYCPECFKAAVRGAVGNATSDCRAVLEGLEDDVRRTDDKFPDVPSQFRMVTAYAAMRMKELKNEAEQLRKALSLFTMAFNLKKEKLDRKWSIGYWEGIDPGLALVNGGPAKHLEDSRFCAVVRYGDEDIKEALDASEKGRTT